MSSLLANTLILAVDNPAQVLLRLRENPALASMQDEHGYSLLHAAASYGHPDLLRALVNEFDVKVDMKDEDGETALFVVETVECAKTLVEELHANLAIRAFDGKTPRERLAEEDDFPQVAVYLRLKELEVQVNGVPESEAETDDTIANHPPPVPEGISLDIGAMTPDEEGEVVDPEFRRRIEELASRPDFNGEAGQAALRALISDAIGGGLVQERDVRQRTH